MPETMGSVVYAVKYRPVFKEIGNFTVKRQ
jgi:hypothetical protein